MNLGVLEAQQEREQSKVGLRRTRERYEFRELGRSQVM